MSRILRMRRKPKRGPNPLNPQNFRDLIKQKMHAPDTIERAVVADKIAVRGWIADKIGRDHLIPLYDICDSAADLRPDTYPLPVVVKPNHTSGPVKFIRETSDWNGLEKQAAAWIATDELTKNEWVYRDIPRRLMVEKMLVDDNDNSVADVRFHCMFGEPVLVVHSRVTPNGDEPYYFKPDWTQLDIENTTNNKLPPPAQPVTLSKMLEIARALSATFDYIRVDLYEFEQQVYCGELTNFTQAGGRIYTPYSFDVWMLDEFYRRRDALISQERNRFQTAEASRIKR